MIFFGAIIIIYLFFSSVRLPLLMLASNRWIIAPKKRSRAKPTERDRDEEGERERVSFHFSSGCGQFDNFTFSRFVPFCCRRVGLLFSSLVSFFSNILYFIVLLDHPNFFRKALISSVCRRISSWNLAAQAHLRYDHLGWPTNTKRATTTRWRAINLPVTKLISVCSLTHSFFIFRSLLRIHPIIKWKAKKMMAFFSISDVPYGFVFKSSRYGKLKNRKTEKSAECQ